MPTTAIGLMRGLHDQLTDADDAFLRIVGYTREDFERGAMSWREMTPPEFLPLDEAGIRQAMQALETGSGGFTLPYRKQFFRKDGSRVPVLLCCAFVPDAPAGTWMGYVVDLSTQSAQHADPHDAQVNFQTVEPSSFYLRLIGELVRERTRLHAIFDNTSSMMWSVDRELRLTSSNAAFQARIHSSVGHTIAMGEPVLADTYPARIRAAWTEQYRRALNGETVELQTDYHFGGANRVFAHVLTPYRNTHGTVIGVAGVSHDITALVEAERRAAQRERDMLEAQRLARVGSWDWDSRYDAVSWTEMMCEIYGWPADQPVPPFATHAPFYSAESWETLLQAVQATREAGTPYELELELNVHGHPRWIVARGEARYDEQGTFVGIHGIVMDVTERHVAEETRRRLESQLLQSQKMQALGQLAGGVAHDFNNILTSILLQLGTMREEVEQLPYVAASVDEVDRAARRASALTQQLLMFSRRQTPDLRTLEVNGVVVDFARMLQRLIGEQYVLEVTPHASPLKVQGDRGMLEQVIMNLAVNARDAMTPGGRITIRTSRGRIAAHNVPAVPGARAGAFVEISVSDTGCGIPEEIQRHLFEPFFTTKPAGMGTGLGLATVYGIVAQHGGWVEFDSRVGRGTTFRVRLPAQAQGETESPGNGSAGLHARVGANGRVRILLVEDEEALRSLIERTLTQHGYDVAPAGDVEQARALWQSAPPFDLVLSDIVLPGHATGIDLMRELRAQHATVPQLLMTGYTEEMDHPQFAERVGVPVLHKPFDIPTLLEAVSAALPVR